MSAALDERQQKHLAEAEAKKKLGNEHFRRFDFTHENEDMRWAVRRYTEALRELDDIAEAPLLSRRGWTPDMPVDPEAQPGAGLGEDGDGDGDEEILELGADGSYDAVAHDSARAETAPAAAPEDAGESAAAPPPVLDGDLASRIRELRISCLLNRAAAHLKTKGHGGNDGAEKDCTVVMKLDPDNVKAHFRRGQARHSMRRFAEAAQDLGRASQLAPKDKKIREALRAAKLAHEEQEKSKKLWNPSEEERRAKAARDERDVIERLTAADARARKEYGEKKWEEMETHEKRRIVLEMAVQEELERTAPKTVRQRDGDLSVKASAGEATDRARQGARQATSAREAASEPPAASTEPAQPEEDSWGAFWKDDAVAEREAEEKRRLEAARKLEAAEEEAARAKISAVQEKLHREELEAEAARKTRRENLEAVAAAQRAAALAHDSGKSPAPSLNAGFLAAPAPEPEPEPEPEPVPVPVPEAERDSAAAPARPESGEGQVWAHCAVPPLHKCRAHYGRRWASLDADTKRLAIVAAEEGKPMP